MLPQFVDCPKCGRPCELTPRPDTQHHGSIRCPVDGFRWIPKPDENRKPRRKVNSDLITTLPDDRRAFCWACLRDRELLRSLRPAVVLQVHHIIEVSSGGTDDPSKLQLLCAECHAEVHRRREAFNRYENSLAEAE